MPAVQERYRDRCDTVRALHAASGVKQFSVFRSQFPRGLKLARNVHSMLGLVRHD
jgi:hypothetical protein